MTNDLRWEKIEGWGYSVSSDGNVRSDSSGRNKYLTLNKCGYLQVHLHKDGFTSFPLVHRLVAQAFIPNPNGFPQVNHINGIKTDNRVENLEWVTASTNQRHRYDVLKKQKTAWDVCAANASRRKAVVCVDTGEWYESVASAAKATKGKRSALSMHLTGRNKTYKGSRWRYANE